MSRLECLGKSSSGPQKQLAREVPSAHAETHKPNVQDTVGKRAIADKPRRTLPPRALPRSAQASGQATLKSALPSGKVLNAKVASPKESNDISPRVEEKVQSIAVSKTEMKMNVLTSAQPPDSAVTVGARHAPRAVEPLPVKEANGEEEQTAEEDAEDEDLKAPVELIMEFLRAVMDRDFQLARKLCQMILIYEPENPEASEFLPLIHKKLLEEQEEEDEDEDEDEEEDDEDDEAEDEVEDDESVHDEESSQSSSCSSYCSSSSTSDDDDEEEEEQEERCVSRHKPCPPSQICP